MEKCIFCRITNGEIPSAKIYEDDDVVSFLDIAPANKGHALIITKKHFETLLDIPDDVICSLMSASKKVARAMYSALGNEGFNLLLNNKSVAGQVVPHAHIHIIPRFSGDGVRFSWASKIYKSKEIDEVRDKIKSFL